MHLFFNKLSLIDLKIVTRPLLHILIGLFITFSSYYALITFSYGAWMYIFGIIALTCIAYGTFFKVKYLKYSAIYLGAVFAAFLFVEVYLEITFRNLFVTSPIEMSGGCTLDGFYQTHPYLGYGPADEGAFSCKKTIDSEELIFDITYSLAEGQRVTPNSNLKSSDAALFFGCSFTYGEGLEDNETIPAYFNELADNRFKVFNYGFSGYGPHQMLANIEKRVARDIEDVSGEKIAVYTFIPDHIKRATGKTPWGRSGPRYELVNGEIEYRGSYNFQSPEYQGSSLERRFFTALHASRLYYQWFIAGKVKKHDIERTVGMIEKSNRILTENGVTFHMVIWDLDQIIETFGSEKQFEYFTEKLDELNIPFVLMSDSISPFEYSDYTIHPMDPHPNEKATKVIANSIFKKTGLGTETSFATTIK